VKATNAYLEPVPSNNILCDAKLSVDELIAKCTANAECASFSVGSSGTGGCLKHCSETTQWINGTGNDGYVKQGGCSQFKELLI